MTAPPSPKDLVVLVPDSNIKSAISTLLGRPKSLKIRGIQSEIYVHVEHDPGCRLRSQEYLRMFHRQFQHALVVFDLEGSGAGTKGAREVEGTVTELLAQAGWNDRAAVVVIDPELENWVWSDSPHVAAELGWRSDTRDLKRWLVNEGHWEEGSAKPQRPKEAMEHALRFAQRPRSSSIYAKLAESVTLKGCTDESLQRLLVILRGWFPPDQ